MARIILDVNDKDFDTILTILNNLKNGMIEKIEVDKRARYNKQKPVIQEPPKPLNLSSKYVDPQTFKERLKRMKEKNGN